MAMVRDPTFDSVRTSFEQIFHSNVRSPTFRGGFYSFYQVNQLIDILTRNGIGLEGRRIIDLGCGATRPLTTSILLYLMGAGECLAIDLEQADDLPGVSVAEYTNILAVISGESPLSHDAGGRPLADLQRRAAGFDMAALLRGRLHDGLPSAIGHRLCRYQDLDDADKKFDLMISLSVFEHIDDLGAVLREARNNVAEDGFIYTSVDFRDHRIYSQGASAWQYLVDDDDHSPNYINKLRFSAMNRLIDDAGFDVVECDTVQETPPDDIVRAILPKYDMPTLDLVTLEGRYLLRPRASARPKIQ